MSGASCECEGTRSERMAEWEVTALRGNSSAFNGYRFTPSAYSEIWCRKCRSRWRTRAAYVDELPRSAGCTGRR